MSNIGEDCIGYICGGNDNNFAVMFFGLSQKKLIRMKKCTADTEFLNSLQNIFNPNQVKAVIVNLYPVIPVDHEELEFYQILKSELTALGILNYFVHYKYQRIATLLMIENLQPTINTFVIYATVSENRIIMLDLKFTKNGYSIDNCRSFQISSEDSAKSIEDKIVGNHIQSIVLVDPSKGEASATYKLLLQSKRENFRFFENLDILKNSVTFVPEMFKWLMDKSYIRYYVNPLTIRQYYLSNSIITDNTDNSVELLIDIFVPLPSTTIVEKKNRAVPCYIYYKKHGDEKLYLFQTIPAEDSFGSFQFSIDEENFPFIETAEIIDFHSSKLA